MGSAEDRFHSRRLLEPRDAGVEVGDPEKEVIHDRDGGNEAFRGVGPAHEAAGRSGRGAQEKPLASRRSVRIHHGPPYDDSICAAYPLTPGAARRYMSDSSWF